MKTHTYSINFYKDFVCSAGECECTCCKGWLIPIDDKAYAEYMKTGGLLGLKLRNHIHTHNGVKVINRSFAKCPFHNHEGLCELQLKCGHDFLCEACREYPRIVYNFGSFASRFIDLSCPEAAKLFVASLDTMHIEESDEYITTDLYGTNDDEVYFKFLCSFMDHITEVILDRAYSIEAIYYYLIEIATKFHRVFVSENNSEKFIDILDDIKNVPDENKRFHLSPLAIDKIMTGGYYHKRVKQESEYLYYLCKLYFKTFDQMGLDKIDRIFHDMLAPVPAKADFDLDMDLLLRRQLWYSIAISFFETYEDYSILRKIGMGIIRNQMFSMFIFLNQYNNKNIKKDEIVKTIYSFHKRGLSSDGIYADFYNLVYKSEFEEKISKNIDFRYSKTF